MVAGPVPTGQGTPRLYVCIEAGRERLRVDVYADPDEYCFRDDAALVGGTLFVGAGHRVITVDLSTREVRRRLLDGYFGYLYPLPDGVLVASGGSLYRIGLDGSLRWAALGIAVDGLLVHEIRDGLVLGDAEQDPPGGWEPFRVSIESGEVCPP